MNQKYVLITGASRGIGRACALAFARNHFHVFLNCRHSLDALQQVEKESLTNTVPAHCSQEMQVIPMM